MFIFALTVDQLGRQFGAIWGFFGAIFSTFAALYGEVAPILRGLFGVILGHFCVCLVIMLWSVWARLGRFWDHVDELLGTFGTDLGPPPSISRSFYGHFWDHFGPF